LGIFLTPAAAGKNKININVFKAIGEQLTRTLGDPARRVIRKAGLPVAK
jgi:hypothetical protein